MDIFSLFALLIIVCSAVVLIKQYRPELALLTAVSAGIVLLVLLFTDVAPLLDKLNELTELTGYPQGAKAVLRAVGIAIVSSLAADSCRDAGQNALAAKAELAGRILILYGILPLVDELLSVIGGFIYR